MHPGPLFVFFGYPVTLYYLFYLLAIITGLFMLVVLTRSRGISLQLIWECLPPGALIVLVSFHGFKYFTYVLLTFLYPETEIHDPTAGMRSFFFILPSIGAAWFFCIQHPISRAQPSFALDGFLPVLALMQGIGRLGCLTAGCCYGKSCQFTMPFFPVTYNLGETLFPTQTIMVIGNFSIAFILLFLFLQRWATGKLVWIYLLLYSSLRLFVDHFRGDMLFFAELVSLSQLVCLVLIALSLYKLVPEKT